MRSLRPVTHLFSAAALLVAVPLRPADPAAPDAAAPDTAAHAALPDRLSDAEFWKLIIDTSEPDAYFRIVDNFTSNEGAVGQVFTHLRDQHVSGDVYMGVGPEQNLTYIAAVRPKMAFIIDIRHQAIMQHLLFKAIFELAKDRAEFISLLFSKPRPASLDTVTSIQQIWTTYETIPTDTAMATRVYGRVMQLLTRAHGFAFTSDDTQKLTTVFNAFVDFGPGITTQSTWGRTLMGNALTFADLTGWDLDAAGKPQSFLTTDDNYAFVKGLHSRNLIVPITGDFGGRKALRGVASWLKGNGGVVRAFYVSNVEQYLFQDYKDTTFYNNVAQLPIDSNSVFIRPNPAASVFGGSFTTVAVRSGTLSFGGGGGSPAVGAGTALCRIEPFLRAVAASRVGSYNVASACPSVRSFP